MPTEVELLRVERKRTSRSARRSRSGIWLKILVACQRNVTSVQKPPKFVAISLRHFVPCFRLFACAQPAEVRLQNRNAIFPLRMTYSGVVGFYFLKKPLTNALLRVIIKVSHKLHNFGIGFFYFVGIPIPFSCQNNISLVYVT